MLRRHALRLPWLVRQSLVSAQQQSWPWQPLLQLAVNLGPCDTHAKAVEWASGVRWTASCSVLAAATAGAPAKQRARRESSTTSSSGTDDEGSEGNAHHKEAAEAVYEELARSGLSAKQLLKVAEGYKPSLTPQEYAQRAVDLLGAEQQLPSINVQELLSRHPNLITVYTVQALVKLLKQVQQLLIHQGKLSAADAGEFLSRCRGLQKLLALPEQQVQVLVEKLRVYHQVIGQPSAAQLFWRSNHRSLTPADDLRARLNQLLQMFGDPDLLHRVLQRSPHLLCSDPVRLQEYWQQHQQTLGMSQQEMGQIVLKQPRFLTVRPDLIAERLRSFEAALQQPDPDKVKALVLDYPSVLAHSSATMTAKLAVLRDTIGIDDAAVLKLVRQQPSLLGASSNTVLHKVEHLKQLLDLQPAQMTGVLVKGAALLTMTPETVHAHMTALQQVLGCSWSEVQKYVRRQPSLLSYAPATIAANMQKLADTSGLPLEEVRRLCLSFITAMQRNPEELGRSMQQMEQLIQQRDQWAELLPQDVQQRQYKLLRLAVRASWRVVRRMEFLLATGQADEVSFTQLERTTNAAWDMRYPEFGEWLAARNAMLKQQRRTGPQADAAAVAAA